MIHVERGDGQPVQRQAFLLGGFQQGGGHPLQLLAPVGQDHGSGHVLKVPPHLEVLHPGASLQGLEPGRFRRGRRLQAHHQDLAGQLDAAGLESRQQIARQLPGAEPALLPEQPGVTAGHLASPGHQGGSPPPAVGRASPPASKWRPRRLWASSRAWAHCSSGVGPAGGGASLRARRQRARRVSAGARAPGATKTGRGRPTSLAG